MEYTPREERLIQSYCRLVLNGKITIEDVPIEYRDEVRRRIINEA